MWAIVFQNVRTPKMSHKTIIARSVFAAVVLASTAVAINAQSKPNWMLTFGLSNQGAHIVGNPAAPTKVVEYMSYTCGHCADFENNEAAPFNLAWPGVSF